MTDGKPLEAKEAIIAGLQGWIRTQEANIEVKDSVIDERTRQPEALENRA